MVTPLEPCIVLVRHPAVSKGPLTCEDMTGREHVSGIQAQSEERRVGLAAVLVDLLL
jgi:hypothetical protein